MRLYPEYQKPGYTYFETFTFQGKEYYRNSIVKLKKSRYKEAMMVQLVEHYLDEKGKEHWTYELWFRSGHHFPYQTFSSPDEVIECIVKPSYPAPIDNTSKYCCDLEVNEVLKGWLIFLVIMALGTFLRDRWTLWIVGSVLFYIWRKFKLRKPPEHDYGFNIEEKVREWND